MRDIGVVSHVHVQHISFCWYKNGGTGMIQFLGFESAADMNSYSNVYFEYTCLSPPAYITSILQIDALVALDMVNWIFYGL